MIKPGQHFHLVSIPLSRPPQASPKELRARARRLRRAIAQESNLQKIADLFHEGLADQDAVMEGSRESDDPHFAAVLGPEGPLSQKFPGELFHSQLRYVPELGLLHTPLFSCQRMGIAFQFAGDQQGLIALWTPHGGGRSDCFRYTLVPEQRKDPRAPTFTTRGGSA